MPCWVDVEVLVMRTLRPKISDNSLIWLRLYRSFKTVNLLRPLPTVVFGLLTTVLRLFSAGVEAEKGLGPTPQSGERPDFHFIWPLSVLFVRSRPILDLSAVSYLARLLHERALPWSLPANQHLRQRRRKTENRGW